MKLNRTLMVLGTVALTFLTFFYGSGIAGAKDADELKPIGVVSFAGYDQLWDAAEKISDFIGYKDTVTSIRSVTADVQGMDTQKPWGIAFLTDGEDVYSVAFLPVPNIEELEFVGSQGLKDEIETNDDGQKYLEFGGDEEKTWEIVEKDGWTYVIQGMGKSAILDKIDPTALLDGLNNQYLLAGKLYCSNIPDELLESAFAFYRQLIAENDVANVNVELAIDLYSWIIHEVDTLVYGWKVSPETGDIDIDVSMVAKKDSVLVDCWKERGKTQWGSFYQPDDSVFSFCDSNIVPEEVRKYNVESCKEVFDRISEAIDVYIDDEKDLNYVHEILDEYRDCAVKAIEAGKSDCVVTLTAEPLLVAAASVTEGNQLQKSLEKVVEHAKEQIEDDEDKETFDRVIQLNVDKINGYQVSVIELSFDDDIPVDNEMLAGKSFCLRLGFRDDKVVVVSGLDSQSVLEKFREVASAPENNITVPDTTAVFSLAEFGKMIGHFLPDAEEGTEDDLVSQLKPYIDILKDASPDAKILVTNTLKDTELTGNIRMTGEHVAAIGKLIQAYLANQMAGLDEDADENIDDSFE